MKKLYFICLLLILTRLPAESQTIYWSEDFMSGQGWYLEDNWSIDGGLLSFSWTPSANNFDLSATSPYITLDDYVGELIVNQYLDIFSNSSDENAEISIITENGEFVLWEYSLAGGSWGNITGSEITFPVSEYAGQTVKFKFRTYGVSTFNWNNWNVFNLSLTAYYENDLAISNFSGPTLVFPEEPNTWTVEVTNNGTNSISDYTVEITDHKTGNVIGSISGNETIEPQQSMLFNIDWTAYAAYNTAFYGIVITGEDQFTGNNSSGSHFVRIDPGLPCNILVWDHDNDIQTIVDPEKGDQITPAEGLKRVLQEAAYDFNYVTALPDNLEQYDIVFSTMGCFCLD